MVYDSEPPEMQTSQFEKNRFFDGKLMTARDMQTEQQYHAERLERVTRQTTGSGIVRGLAVRSVESTDGELEVAIDPGFAIDGAGRPIVVDTSTTTVLPAPDGDTCYLYVGFDELALESVPVPDADGPVSETEANRLVEGFELTYREREPDRVPIRSLDLDIDSLGDDPSTLADHITEAYHNAHRTDEPDPEETAVYLGGFERQADGSWVRSETAPQPEYVVDNELLYATLIEHLSNTDNPHQTEAVADQPEPDLDPAELDGIHERVDYLQSELADLKDRHQTTTTHLRRKTLDSTARLFQSTADMLADHDGSVSKTAREIATQLEAASHEAVHTDPAQYLLAVRELQASLVAFGDQLAGTASEPTVERYLDAVDELQSTLAAGQPAVEVAVALDGVAEAAVDLKLLHTAGKEL